MKLEITTCNLKCSPLRSFIASHRKMHDRNTEPDSFTKGKFISIILIQFAVYKLVEPEGKQIV